MPVLGMGGIFFRAQNPEALSAWYRTHLGVGAGCSADPQVTPNIHTWTVQGGPLVFAPFPADSDYFAAEKAFMLNFRVSDLDGLLADLRVADVAVITKAEWDHPEVGRFARIHDPEGHAIELWEPPAPD
ncbi:VOC family protein [Sphingobium estronivorans]|uniref:VOC family protein n=1 Tax=Sphingobium estronivorans TaxID=1577690 RepID=UPI00123BFC27|nr:VOC family protein [Sphingobium estronivorans]